MFKVTEQINIFDGIKIDVYFETAVGYCGIRNWFIIKDKNDTELGCFTWNDELIAVVFCGNIPQYAEVKKFVEEFGFFEKKILTNTDSDNAVIYFQKK